jgi:hypothetical protein
MTKDELVILVRQEMKGLSTQFEEEDYINAVEDALRDTGWTLPETNATKLKWIKDRTKRHLFFMMVTVSAHKFKFKQYNLQNRFEHYFKLIEKMDEAWSIFQTEELLTLEGAGGFGTKIAAGFSYDEFGRDTTYGSENVVTINPSDSDV